MEKNKKLDCLFGFHDWFTAGCIRQCNRCKMVAIYNPEFNSFEDIGVDRKTSIKQIHEITEHVKKFKTSILS